MLWIRSHNQLALLISRSLSLSEASFHQELIREIECCTTFELSKNGRCPAYGLTYYYY